MKSKKICAAILAAALSVSAVSVTACLKVTTLEAAAAAAGDAQSDTYAITKGTEGSGGSFVIDKTEAAEGDTVTVTATHGQNFAAKIVVKAADNTAVTVTPDSDNPSVSFPVGSDPVGEVTSKFTFTMPAQEVTVTGEFTQYYPITNKTNDANGTITIDKPVAAYDETLTITVSPNEGYELYELTAKGQRPDGTNDKVWTAEDVVDGKITTTMPRDTLTFTAEFKKTGYFHISSSAVISGKSQSPWAKLNVGETVGKGDAKEGDTVTLTVSDKYLRLKSLKVTNENDQTSISLTPAIDAPVDFGENTTKTFTFTMPAADVLIEAEAAQIQPIEKSDTTNGTISLDKEFAETGDTVTITVTPDEGYGLDEINVKKGTASCELETVAAGTKYTFVVPGPGRYTVDATFKKTGYFHISSSAVISGKSQSPWAKLNVGETVGKGDAKEGDTVTLTVSDKYLRLKSLKVTTENGQTSIPLTPAIDAPVDFGENTTKTFTFTMPAADVLIEAEAAQIQPIEKSDTTNGTISLDKEFAETGDTVTITVTPDEGYELDEINVKKGTASCELETVAAGATYTFVVPGPGRYTVDATFKKTGYFHISSSAVISGKSQSPWAKLNVGETVGKGDAKEGDTVTLTVSDKYLRLKSLKVTTENGQTSIPLTPAIDAPVDFGENTTKTFTFTMPAADVLIEAEAAQIQPIEKSDTTNGTISLDKEFAETGDTVTITVTPDEGYELDGINVKKGTASCELETVTAGTKYTFVVPGPGRYTVDATFKKIGSESGGNTTTPDDNDDNTTTTTPSTSAPDDNDDNTTTTPPSTSTVAPVEVAKVDAEVKAGETATVKAEGLGDITVTVDKDDANLAGAKVEFSATNTEKTVKDNIDKAVGTDATEETKAMATAAVEAVKKGDAIALDIGFTKDGKDVQPGKDVTVTVPLPAALKDALKVYVYHVSDKGIEDVTEKCSVKDGKLTIKNDKFSPYIVSKVEIEAAAAAPATSEPTTTNNPNTGVVGFVVPIVIAAGALTAVIVSKKRK